jgi:hypothetical protein
MSVSTPESGGWTPRILLIDLMSMLAHTLGQEKSTEVVEAAAARLAIKGPMIERHDAEALLDFLSRTAGLVGIAARFAQRRAFRGEESPPPSSIRSKDQRDAPPSTERRRADSATRASLVELLTPSLGQEKAEEEVTAATRRLGFSGVLDMKQAGAVLDDLAGRPGAIGATARFAKARFLLRK